VAIGERRAPAPEGRPGFIRIDSVHQGDQDGVKGVYHINAVDCLTQWELVATCEKIAEAYLLPVIEALLSGFPFRILGFHADNGSEYINHRVAKLLDKLRVEFTKSRPRRSNDNGLAETKNGAVVRKHLGYIHIPQRFASEVNAVSHRVLEPLSQLPSPLPVRRGNHRQEGQDQEALPAASGDDPVRKTDWHRGRRGLPQARHYPRILAG
jgi:transposase InsO family protein